MVSYNIYYDSKKSYLDKELQNLSFQYETISKELEDKGDIYFNEIINSNSKILTLLNSIDDNKDKWQEIREKLILEISPSFERMKKKSIRQFHFHTKDNISFLRMHKLTEFGDSLDNIRYSVKSANKNLQSYHGFEEGKIYNGFRNVYPVIDKGKHLGSVEISFSFKAVSNALQNTFKESYSFIIAKDLIDNKVAGIKDYYTESKISPYFYCEKPYLKKKKKNTKIFKLTDKIADSIKDLVADKLEKRVSFSVYTTIESKRYIVNFLSVKNIENLSVAYILNFSEDKFLITELKKSILYNLIADIFAFLIILAIIFHVRDGELSVMNNFLKDKNNIVFVHKKGKIIASNKKFLKLFEIKSVVNLELYKKDLTIFEVGKDGFLLIDKNENMNSILNKLMTFTKAFYNIRIFEKSSKIVRTFSVTSVHLEEQGFYIQILSDITSSETIIKEIEDKQNRDNLTNSYLNKKFQIDIKQNIASYKTFSIIVFDINNFHFVNDELGYLGGDKIKIEIINLVNKNVRKCDVVYKFSNTEFVIMTNSRMKEAKIIATNLSDLISKHKFFKETKVNSNFAIMEHQKFESFEDILNRADKTLNLLKESKSENIMIG